MIEYCNITTDLQNVYAGIESFAGNMEIYGFTESGDNYAKTGTGLVKQLTEDGSYLTLATSTTLTVGQFYYDSSIDTLYLRCSDDEEPSTHEIEINSSTWAEVKSWARQQASGTLEAMLSSYPRPLPVSKLDFDYTGSSYDPDITRAAALLTCAYIISRVDPQSTVALSLRNEVWNKENNSGLIYGYYKGESKFSFENIKQNYHGNIVPISESADGRITLRGNFKGSNSYILRLKISTSGAVETAKFDLSDDDGLTYFYSGIKTYNQYQELFEGIYIRFEGTFTTSDEWKIYLSDADEPIRGLISNIVLERN